MNTGYHDGAGFPNGVIKECDGAVPSIISWDNAWAHDARAVLDFVHCELGAVTNPGRPACPTARNLVESIFKVVAAQIHRLPSSTGGFPGDPAGESKGARRQPPAISRQEVEDIVEVVIANYNARPKASLQGRSPLDVIRDAATEGFRPVRHPDPEKSIRRPNERTYVRTVRGNSSRGDAPHVNIEHGRYRGPCLEAADVIGSRIQVKVLEDARYAEAVTLDGKALGELRVQGRWAVHKHSIRTRQRIYRRLREKPLSELVNDPVSHYLAELFAESGKPKKALELARVSDEIVEDEDKINSAANDPNEEANDPDEEVEWKPRHG